MSLKIQSFVVSEPRSFETSVSRKTIFSDDISCVNLIVVWNKLAKSTKSLISRSDRAHTENMSSINLFQRIDFVGWSQCFG